MLMSSVKRIFRSILVGVFVVIIVMIAVVGSHQTVAAVHAVTGDGSPGDPNIKYMGRWEMRADTEISYWPGAYLITHFTGTSVKVKLPPDRNESANMFVSIDDELATSYPKATGTLNLTPTSLKSGKTHSLQIIAASEHDDIRFQGLILDSGATTVATNISPHLVEFVGDSITSGIKNKQQALDDYAWKIGERLSVRHTQIAQSGIGVVSGPKSIGMSDQYFKLRTLYFPTSPDWDFAHNPADAVVINLGTNDSGGLPFQSTYITFLQNIRAKYPHAHIFVLGLFKGGKLRIIQDVVKAVNATGDRNVQYVNTTGWITAADTLDTLHPTCTGQTKIANKLGPIIASLLNSAWKPLPILSQPC